MSGGALPGPDDIARRELPNGAVLLARENPHAPSVVVAGSLHAGSLYEAPDRAGLAAFVAAALLRGTTTRDFAAIHDLLESNGASLGIGGGMHTAGFSGRSLAGDLPLLLDLLSDSLRHPSFEAAQIERLRGEMITAQKIREQNTRFVAGRAFRALAYPADHPYSRSPAGTAETLAAVIPDDLWAFHRQHYTPRGMILVMVGAVEPTAALDAAERALGDWPGGAASSVRSVPAAPPLENATSESVFLPGKSQTDLVLGAPGPPRLAGEWHAASLANSILGVFGMYGRIGAAVREKRGLAYYCYSRLDGGPGPGPWRVIAGVNPADVEPAVEAIRAELRRLLADGVTDKELADSRANFIGRLPLQLEHNEGVAGSILSMEQYRLGLDYLQRYAALIASVSADEVNAAARHYLDPSRLALAAAGPAPVVDGRAGADAAHRG